MLSIDSPGRHWQARLPFQLEGQTKSHRQNQQSSDTILLMAGTCWSYNEYASILWVWGEVWYSNKMYISHFVQPSFYTKYLVLLQWSFRFRYEVQVERMKNGSAGVSTLLTSSTRLTSFFFLNSSSRQMPRVQDVNGRIQSWSRDLSLRST